MKKTKQQKPAKSPAEAKGLKVLKEVARRLSSGGGEGSGCPIPATPGTVTVYEAMENLSKPKCNVEDAAERCVKLAVDRTAKSMKKEYKVPNDCCHCKAWDLKTEAVMGRDPDNPEVISNCGNVYVARASVSFLNWRNNLHAVEKFMSELEKNAGREAFITSMECSNNNIMWSFMFRVKAKKTSKRK